MNINLNDEQMRSVVSGAILQTLTPEMREQLVKEAIVSLLVPDRGPYGSKKTPLQEAFEFAAIRVARDLISDKMEKDEAFRSQIQGIIVDAVNKAFVEKRQETVDRLASSLGSWLAQER